MPEWAHLRTQQRVRPKRGTEDQHEQIFGEYSFGEFTLVAAGFHLQSDGKVRIRSVSVPTRGFDEHPRRRAPSWAFQNQNRLKLSLRSLLEKRLSDRRF